MYKLNGYEVILASESPRRKAFFEKLGIPFKIGVYPVDESFPSHLKGIEIPEYIVNRFKRERRAAMRNAKLRLSNVKLAEIAATMRNKSKQIKH